MTWQDQLQQGKFRDATFFTASSEGSIGRRTNIHKYPLRDKIFVEDLGRREREFSLDCYVIGQDYMSARDRLIKAVEKPGPGPLVHHWLGAMTVSVVACRITESTDRGGFATFSITFVEAGENTYPAGSSDTRIAVDTAADLAIEIEGAEFEDQFSIHGVASFVSDAAIAIANGGVDSLIGYARGWIQVPDAFTKFLSTATGIKGTISTLLNNPLSFVSSWTGLVSQFQDVFIPDDEPVISSSELIAVSGGRIIGSAPLPADVADAQTSPIRYVSAPEASRISLRNHQVLANTYQNIAKIPDTYKSITQSTSSRVRQVKNQDALSGMFRRTALIEETRALRLREFPSQTEAFQLRDDLAARMDAQAETAIDDAVYQALGKLRSVMVKDVTERSSELPRIIRYVPNANRLSAVSSGSSTSRTVQYTTRATLPALVVAHQLYGDATRSDELIYRNPVIRHPGFVPGGQPLEALSDA